MDSAIVLRAAGASLLGSLSFPEIVGQLVETGVEFYQVDYLALEMRFYDGGGAVIRTAIDFGNLPPVAVDFDAAALRAAILDSQQNGQKFRDFTRRAMAAGVHGYFAFLRGKRVTYFGRAGDQHTEWFPGAK